MGLPVVVVCWQIVPEDLPDRSRSLGNGPAILKPCPSASSQIVAGRSAMGLPVVVVCWQIVNACAGHSAMALPS
jgi:hypothetical protein